MASKEVMVPALDCTCERCGHTWVTRRNQLPANCPKQGCKTPYWNKPRRSAIKAAVAEHHKQRLEEDLRGLDEQRSRIEEQIKELGS